MTDERAVAHGRYEAVFRDTDGNELRREAFGNVVTTVGKNQVWAAALVASATLVGPFLGLISSASFSAVSAADTMASHAGWLEADASNAPPYTVGGSAVRAGVVFGAPSGGAASITPIVFTFTGSGTVQGGFMAFGSGAVNTQGSTAGVLLSAGTLTTPQPVVNGNTLTLSYSISM